MIPVMWDPIPENSGPCNQHYFVMKQMWIIKRFSKKSIAETKSKQDIEKVEPKKRGQKKRPRDSRVEDKNRNNPGFRGSLVTLK